MKLLEIHRWIVLPKPYTEKSLPYPFEYWHTRREAREAKKLLDAKISIFKVPVCSDDDEYGTVSIKMPKGKYVVKRVRISVTD